jgi:hypothetical protein
MQAVTRVNAEPNGQARIHEDGADQILRQAEDEWHVLDEEDQKTVLKRGIRVANPPVVLGLGGCFLQST